MRFFFSLLSALVESACCENIIIIIFNIGFPLPRIALSSHLIRETNVQFIMASTFVHSNSIINSTFPPHTSAESFPSDFCASGLWIMRCKFSLSTITRSSNQWVKKKPKTKPGQPADLLWGYEPVVAILGLENLHLPASLLPSACLWSLRLLLVSQHSACPAQHPAS